MSKKLLLNADKYCLATFPTTHSALHAEKVLDVLGLPFLIVPTPKEISAGCGLSIRVFCEDLDTVSQKLRENNAIVKEFFQMEKTLAKTIASPLSNINK